VPILNEFHPTEIHHILRHSGASALFVSERLYHKVEEFDLDKLNVVILIDNLSVISPEWGKDRLRRLYAEGSRELKRIKHMALQKVGLVAADVPEDAPASIIYTSGTTGHSKGRGAHPQEHREQRHGAGPDRRGGPEGAAAVRAAAAACL
jgi:long-chain acyl-CoA synthetase